MHLLKEKIIKRIMNVCNNKTFILYINIVTIYVCVSIIYAHVIHSFLLTLADHFSV